ncbi:hypothetical protein CLAFUR4_13503 [Fulvia fulva]|nr:hypothetical protein CLAFUR4_13503 [Fulvia fulva]KAK4612693.1 hypothetical protein CLAFUR0_13511 [Fulvia fulva]WPV36047.1 hypothetical protein CLAFUW7_13507 [Fulvia fulva]
MVSGHASPAAIYTAIWTTTLLAILAVALRIFTTAVIVRQLKCDDYLILGSLGFVIVFTGMVTLETYNGLGRHQASLSNTERTNLLRWLWISIILYHIGLGLAKLSIVSQCLRVFGSTRKFVIACYIVGAILIAFTVFITVFLCKPVFHFWHPERPGTCLPRLPVRFINSAPGVLSDILVATLPLPVPQSLNLPNRQKCTLTSIFALSGAIYIIITIIHFYALYAITSPDDPSYENPQTALSSNLEASASTIDSYLPTCNAFIAKHFPNGSGATGGARGSRSSKQTTQGGSEASRGSSETTTQVGTLTGIGEQERRGQEGQIALGLVLAGYHVV